ARGELVDEDALVDALRSGKVAGAALDVYSQEPYDGPLLEFDNVVATPHLAASTGEAQDRAGVIVAEQVAAALEGGLVSNAVNIPVLGAEELEVLGPYVPLASKLGRLAMELAEGHADEIVLTSYGGLEVREERSQSSRDFTNLVRVEVRKGEEKLRVAGTLIGKDNRQWLVSALGFELAPLLVLLRYDDIPGVIGRVGMLFGDAGINIAHMTVSRNNRGGKALMVLSVDTAPPDELVERIRTAGFDEARVLRL